MMEILDMSTRGDRICTMKLAFRCVSLDVVMMDLCFEGNRLAVDISVANDRIRHLFEDEIYDFLYHFKKNRFIISSLDIHVEGDEKPLPEHSSAASELKEKWLRVMYPETTGCQLDAFA